jgi:hypothetical protein
LGKNLKNNNAAALFMAAPEKGVAINKSAMEMAHY